jgi:fibronectin type 3 domain-containing protein
LNCIGVGDCPGHSMEVLNIRIKFTINGRSVEKTVLFLIILGSFLGFSYSLSINENIASTGTHACIVFPPAPPRIAAPPGAPQNLVATAGNSQIAITWQIPLSDGGVAITNYKIYRGISLGGESLFTTLGNVTTFNDLIVIEGTTYYYKVSAVNGDGESPQSNEASATPMFPPGVPRNLQVIAGNGQLVVSWQVPASSGSTPVLGYKVYRGTTSTGETLYLSIGNETMVIDWGVQPGHKYFYQISALNTVGEGIRSGEKNSTPLGVPDVPRGFHVSISSGHVRLDWLMPANNGGSSITSYSICRGTTPGAESSYTTVGNITSFIDTSVTLGISYYYTICAVNGIGEGQASGETSITPATVPTAPRNLQVTRDEGRVTLSWETPADNHGSGIINYKIYRSTSAGTEAYLTTVENVTQYTDMDIQDDQIYYYKIIAVNEAGDGDASEEESIEASTLVDSFPPFLQNLIGILIIIAGDITAIGAAISANKKKLRDTSTAKHAIDGECHAGFGDCVTLNVGMDENTVAAGDHVHDDVGEAIPSGFIVMYSSDSPPDGWLLCDGAEIRVKEYPALFATIGTTYGGDGSSKFFLPDLRRKIGRGADVGDSVHALENVEPASVVISYIIRREGMTRCVKNIILFLVKIGYDECNIQETGFTFAFMEETCFFRNKQGFSCTSRPRGL